jgi:hypothetical protein
MRCIECDAADVSERRERTTRGYRRFRCRACGKLFNERSGGILNRTQYPSDVIAGRPQAKQIADRFHLVQNLRVAIQRQLSGLLRPQDRPRPLTDRERDH